VILIRNIAIISKDEELLRLVELEADFIGASSSSFSEVPSNLLKFDVVIVDLDTLGTSVSSGNYTLVGITRAPQKEARYAERCDVTLEYPFLLRELREIICASADNGFFETPNTERAQSFYSDAEKRMVEFLGVKVYFSDYEYRVLQRLCQTPSVPVSREELSALFESDDPAQTNMADVYICHIRKKLSEVTEQKIIFTVRGRGYMTKFTME
jgi:hypothetical protein